jgi:flavin-dependent dehydrogenase
MSTERGAITSSRKIKAVYREHIALIGDASGSVDAITVEGLYLAFRQATALADAIECRALTGTSASIEKSRVEERGHVRDDLSSGNFREDARRARWRFR